MSCFVANNSIRTRQRSRHAQSDNPMSHSSTSNISLLIIRAQNSSKATIRHFSFWPSVKHTSTIIHTLQQCHVYSITITLLPANHHLPSVIRPTLHPHQSNHRNQHHHPTHCNRLLLLANPVLLKQLAIRKD
jgi:hypothetical protein